DLEVDGTLVPGALEGGGVLSVAGDVHLKPGSTFHTVAPDGGELGQLVADGKIRIDGSHMRVTASDINFEEDGIYPVMRADGGIEGGFISLETRSEERRVGKVYTGRRCSGPLRREEE